MRFRVKFDGDVVHAQAFSNNKRDKIPLARATWSLTEMRASKAKRVLKIAELSSKAAEKFEKDRGVSRYKTSKEK